MRYRTVLLVVMVLSVVAAHARAEPLSQQSKVASWNAEGRVSRVLVEAGNVDAALSESADCSVTLWVQLEGKTDTYPALASSKAWENGEVVDLLSDHNMGVTLTTGNAKGWTLAVQPNGSWLWNVGNGEARLDYMPTAERQPINDGRWHLLAFTIDRASNTARLYYDGLNVAIYALNGFGDLAGAQNTVVGGDKAGELSPARGMTGEVTGASYHGTALTDEDIFELYQSRFPNAQRDLPAAQVNELKVLAWNIWHGARHPGVEKGIAQAVDFIKTTGADVITMQETYGSGPIIADRLGYYFYLRSNNLSVMSRYPIEDTHDLYQPFRFGGVTLRLNEAQRVNVFSLWIHYLPAWRRDTAREGATAKALIEGEWTTRASELREILIELRPFVEASDDVPLIVGGDFNSPSTLDWTAATADWHNGLVVDWPVSRQMLDLGFTDTYRAIHPDPTEHEAHELWSADARRVTYRIDYIYTHGRGVRPTASRMMNTHNGAWSSDHPAVLSTLRLGAPSPESPELGIISYNILEGFTNRANDRFPAGEVRQRAVSDWLAKQAPAMVGFQELNGYTAERLAEESKAWGHGHAATVKDTGYIVGLTSRESIEVIERHLDGMHHGVLHARTMGIDCFVVHLSPFKYQHRQREAAMILERVNKAVQAGRPVIVMGDFNALSPQDRAAYDGNEALLERLRDSDARHDHVDNLDNGEIDYSVMQAFIDAGLIDLYAKHRDEEGAGKDDSGQRRIDFIFASPDLADRLVRAGWYTSERFKTMSDHPPVSAWLKWTDDDDDDE